MYKRVISLFLFLAIVLALPGVAYATDNDHVYIRDQEEFDDFSDTTVTLSEKEALALFTSLNDTPLMAASGVAAWEGRLFVAADGTFTGIYEDSDADMIYQSYFSGRFSQNVELHGQTYWLWVEELTTDQDPGTRSTDKYGDPVTYIDAPFSAGECMVLTLPGTPDSKIPEMVRGEIGGTLDIWENFSSIYTLTRQSDGWGFFTKPEDFVARPATDDWEILAMNWTGIWQSRTTASRLYIFQEEGGLGDYQVVHVMEKNGETRAIRGSLYSLDEITVDYDVPGILHAAIVGDPYHGSLTLTSFPILDDRMTSWMPVIEVDYEYVGPMDDPNNQIPASVWDLIRIGLDPIAAPTAAPAPNPAPAPDIGSGSVLVDDAICTIVCLGKATLESETYVGLPMAYYHLAVTNHLDRDFVLVPGTMENMDDLGSVNGYRLYELGMFFEDGNPDHLSLLDRTRPMDGYFACPIIPAGATVPIGLRPSGGGYSYRTPEELVNVIVNLHLQYDEISPSIPLNQNYSLRMNEGETYQREAFTGYVRHESNEFGFSFEIPNNWIASEYNLEWLDHGNICLLPPPELIVAKGCDSITVQTMPSDFKNIDDPSFITLPDRSIGGRAAVGMKNRNNGCTYYFIALNDSTDIMITDFCRALEPEFEHFLDSVRFTSNTSLTDVTEAPAEDTPTLPFGPTEAHVMVDDDICTIEYLGKAIYEDVSSPLHSQAYFRTAVTNHLSQDIVILPIKGDHSMEAYVDGNGTIGLLLFTENWQHTQFVEGNRGVVIPAGSTVEVYMMPRGYEAGYQTTEELVNAQLFVQLQYDPAIRLSGLEKNYELHFCEDETYMPAAKYRPDMIRGFGNGFSFERPNDWRRYQEVPREPTPGTNYYLLIPPHYSIENSEIKIHITLSNAGEYFRHIEGDGFKQLADQIIDQCPAYVYQHQDLDQTIYVILLNDGISLEITINKDRHIADQFDPIIEHFLNSIRFDSGSVQPVETAVHEPAALPAPVPTPSSLPGSREGDALVDDDVCTITYLGKKVGNDPHFSYGPAAYYCLAITNHTDQKFTAEMTSGTVNGMMLWDRLLFREDHGYTSLRNYAPIPAGETKTVWLWPIGVGYGYRHEEELVNAVIGIRVKDDAILNREYTLTLNPGESYQPPQRTAGYQTCTEDAWQLSYEIPVDWDVYYREKWSPHMFFAEPPREYDWIEILPSPSAEEGIYHIRIQELDSLDPDFASWKTEETLVDGFPVKVYYDNHVTSFYVNLGNGRGMSFLVYHVETSKEEAQPAAIDRFIHSIRFLSVQHPTPVPNASPAVPDLSAWQGYWMTRDDSLAEMIITDNGDGTLHARAMFLPAGDSEATLTPQADGSMRFEDQYGNLVGMIVRQTDEALRLTITGGSTMEDEEATEYQGYFARGFTFCSAAYDEMWSLTSSEATGSDDDWLGDWMAVTDNGFTTLHIGREGVDLVWNIMLGQYRFTGLLEKNTDSIADLYNEDFFGTLVLNRKLKKIAMLNVGSSMEGVYDWMSENTWYGVVIYQPMPKVTFQIPENNMSSSDQTRAVLPGALQPSPAMVTLLPIPGKAGVMQVPVARVDATSHIIGSKDPTAYAPVRVLDGEETTAFQFSTDTTPLGQAYLSFDFDEPVTLDELWMKNGFWKTTNGLDQYTRNSRVKKMTIFVRYAGSDEEQMLKDVTLKDDGGRKDWKVINMLGVQNVIGVRIRIDEIYRGSKFPTDVCISEIMFVQHAEH